MTDQSGPVGVVVHKSAPKSTPNPRPESTPNRPQIDPESTPNDPRIEPQNIHDAAKTGFHHGWVVLGQAGMGNKTTTLLLTLEKPTLEST